jgi:hypothetical protein
MHAEDDNACSLRRRLHLGRLWAPVDNDLTHTARTKKCAFLPSISLPLGDADNPEGENKSRRASAEFRYSENTDPFLSISVHTF